MSLIFKALQRFGHPESTPKAEVSEEVADSVQRRNAFTLRKILLSPTLAIVVAAGIFISGLIVSQVAHLLPKAIKPNTQEVNAAVTENAGEVDSTSPEHHVAADTPEPAVFELTPPQKPQEVTFQVHPPDLKKASVSNGHSTGDQMHVSPAGVNPDLNGQPPAQREKPSVNDNQTSAMTHNEDAGGMYSLSEDNGQAQPHHRGEPNTVLGMVDHRAMETQGPATSDRHGENGSAGATSEKKVSFSSNNAHRRRSAQATRHLEISQLAGKIHSAIQADDVELASKLLGQLARIKGSDNVFVLKLKSYSLIRQNRLDEAGTILSRVLARDAGDLEAGLNMAVVEIRLQKYESARNRLVQLQGQYPEESKIASYLRQLPIVR